MESPGSNDSGNTRVELYDPLATSAVSGIYALETRNSRLTVHQNTSMSFSTSVDVSVKSGLPALYFAGYNGFSVRQVILGSEIAVSGNYVRITLKASSLADAFGTTLDNQGVCLSHVSIVERSGETVNGTTAPAEITFNGGQSGVTIAKGEVAVSDPTPFIINNTKSYLLIMDVAESAVVSAQTNANVKMPGRVLVEPATIPVNYAQKGSPAPGQVTAEDIISSVGNAERPTTSLQAGISRAHWSSPTIRPQLRGIQPARDCGRSRPQAILPHRPGLLSVSQMNYPRRK